MKIRLLLNIGTNETEYPHLKEGEHEVSREDGMKLIQRGWAVSLEPPAADIKSIPPMASIRAEADAAVKQSVEKATADVKTYREKTSRATETKPANKEQ